MNNTRTFRSLLATSLSAAVAAAVSAQEIELDTTLPHGPTVGYAVPGGTFEVLVSVFSPVPVEFNAALWRLVVTEEGATLEDYGWTPPFITGGSNDFSLGGAELPLVLDDETLEGKGYPIDTADVEFGNFDFVQSATDGTLMRLGLRAPKSASPGDHFLVVAVPDLFTDGFVELPSGIGVGLRIEIVESITPGDLDQDGEVGAADLASFLSRWGGSEGGNADFDGDGTVGPADLLILLGNWG
jgi:hypothetical protein